MSLAPEVQHKAQIELDAVLGSRLPNMEDLETLSYCRAVFLETMRWAPVTPLGVYHRLVDGADDELHGYIIRAGSTVIPVRVFHSLSILHRSHTTLRIFGITTVAYETSNVELTYAFRAMLHNPIDYECPEEFNPDRFLINGRPNPKVKNPLLAAFGFGRRYVVLSIVFRNLITDMFVSASALEDILLSTR